MAAQLEEFSRLSVTGGMNEHDGTAQDKLNARDAQRLETRQRVYAAVIAEFRRIGMAAPPTSAPSPARRAR